MDNYVGKRLDGRYELQEVIAVFGFPVFILFVIFFFRYKNRKARYRLAEQALAARSAIASRIYS